MGSAKDTQPKEFTIIVNGRKKQVAEKELTFWEIVHLAFPDATPAPLVYFTVAYRRGRSEKPKGTVVEGESVHIHEGMIFDVTRTDRS